MSESEREFKVEKAGGRVDHYVADCCRDVSRSRIKLLIRQGWVRVNGKEVKPHYAVRLEDLIHVEIPEIARVDNRAEDIPLNVIYEDQWLMAVNKPAGLIVHPGNGNPRSTLVNALLYYLGEDLSNREGIRPGIVHRLDKDTSGVILVAKSDLAQEKLCRLFRIRKIQKEYRAIVRGLLDYDETKCEEAIGRAFVNRRKIMIRPSGGKDALTFFKVLERHKRTSYLAARPMTGRTHQIRVHSAYLGHPILGDILYGGQHDLAKRSALHAFSLEFIHPFTQKEMILTAPVPEDMETLLTELRKT